jgi:hypothetical protein
MAKGGTHSRYLRVLLLTAGLLGFAVIAAAQTDSSSSADKKKEETKAESKDADQGEVEGQVWGDYKVHQSVEFGVHIVDSAGSPQMYNTFVNLNTGPRLLGTELSMQSTTHQSLLFDNLYLSTFGFGGDPENMARLRVQKNKWYNFVGLYRRDKNYFDYNLFGNPLDLNAGSTTCGGPVGGPPTCVNAFTPSALSWYTNSPHLQFTTRNMGDFSLTLLPESAISFRLGYARNNTHGRMDTTLEAPIRTLLTEDSGWRSDRYQFGVDVKVIPRTTISGDVFLEHDKNDWDFVDNNLLYLLGNATGPQIDPGILVPPLTGAVPTCAGANTVSINASGFFRIITGCNGILLNTGPGSAYFKRGNVRTSIPTGQLSLQSSYFRNLEITASGTYSSATSEFLNFQEFMHGSNSDLNSGTPKSERISANADFGVTYHISKSWSVSDKFRWVNWRESGGFTNTLFRCAIPAGALGAPTGFPAGPVTLTPLRNPCNSDVLTLTGLTTAGNATSGTYEQISTTNTLLGERSYFNTVKVAWQPSRHFSGYVGYRFGQRELRLGDLGFPGSPNFSGTLFSLVNTFTNNGTGTPPLIPTTTTFTGAVEAERINLHTALLGVVVRPTDAWRINADVELLGSDSVFTNISPRHQQRLRVYTTYKTKRWLSLNGGVHFVETRNGFAPSDTVSGTSTPLFPTGGVLSPYGHKDHWRYYTAGIGLNPNSKIIFDLGWTYLNQDINSATCMPVPANAFTGLTAPTACADGATARALLLHYRETTHSGYTSISYQPVKRVTLNVGYEITADNGRTDWLRLDTGQLLQVVGDVFGNSPAFTGNPITPCPGASVVAGCVFAGPFADQPLGPQAINWHKLNAGLTVEVVRGVQFRGLWSYYDYNSKDEVPALVLLQVVAPRGFHANVGTLSLKYSF